MLWAATTATPTARTAKVFMMVVEEAFVE